MLISALYKTKKKVIQFVQDNIIKLKKLFTQPIVLCLYLFPFIEQKKNKIKISEPLCNQETRDY